MSDDYFSQLIRNDICRRTYSENSEVFSVNGQLGDGQFKRLFFEEGLEVASMAHSCIKTSYEMNFECSDDFLELGYIERGSCTMYFTETDKTYTLDEGDIFIYRMKNKVSTFGIELNACKSISVKIAPEIFTRQIQGSGKHDYDQIWKELMDFCFSTDILLSLKASEDIKRVYSEACLLSIDEPLGWITYKAKILEMSYKILEKFKSHEMDQDRLIFTSIIQYIASRISEYISLDELVDHSNLSKYYIQKLFSKYKQMTVHQYIRQARLENASALLRESMKSVLEIAHICGYDNPSKFSKAFKDKYYMTPIKYRKQYEKKAVE